MTTSEVRVRFCPSPTGTPHVGLIRTALFNWAFARHHGGAFVFRIEDTDAARDSEESYQALLDALRWLGLNWDEGPEVGGPYEPYRQSQRRELHLEVVAKLLAAGEAYESFSTPEEVEARHRAAGRDPKLGYDNFDRDLTAEQRQAYLDEGRKPVVRLRMPDHDLTWNDLVRGETTFKSGTVPDFALTRGNGIPLYTLVNPVDDATMKITHVLRGEDLLSSTPRQLALYEALERIGVADLTPEFGHLPFVMGQGNKKLSKRDPEADLFIHRERGFVPEGLLNYLALLGWSLTDDRDVFSLDEMVSAFDISTVNSNPARFDQKKADAINAEHIRQLDPAEFAARLRAFLTEYHGLGAVDDALFATAADLVQTRIVVLSDAWDLLKFLFVDESEFTVDPAAAAKNLGADAGPVLDAAIASLESVDTWTASSIEEALKSALIDGLGLKPRKAFAPVRVGVTGSHISPPLYESMELLGRDVSSARLRSARSLVPAEA
ncbi:glutamate--tRNA ligase [Rhodococcus triatomae]|uniref:Glutamate--tRNA ligase n=1 Tax=Rhodococcus triatomae TaxID=300028 RepID=A0A1G8EQX6_9NOCA|nr:glutamate--tRNA ligase [Rhodococcus triatomae]QNG19265.1 glutamate--tRNA ligase [Rhodococcus triatomae]QNG24822.1 glutamate--tRNA ligase [Rhodococcus triatomae]SDH72139.1 glutamyl-tRNA synthetase [Rhodococcus triatomae]